jgi:CheY-like chemotaxis protein
MGRKVLIAEDEALVALDLSAQLRTLGFVVLGSATSGEEIIRLAAELKPDIILMDLRLQGRIGGLQAAAEIQSKQNKVIVVFVTASSDKKTLEKLGDWRNNRVLTKPFSNEQLMDVLKVLQ